MMVPRTKPTQMKPCIYIYIYAVNNACNPYTLPITWYPPVPETNMENRAYIKYSPDLEKIPDGEAEDIQAVAKQLNDIQRAQYNVHRHCFSGTHARTQGIVKGKFIVPDDLPQHLKQGELFSKGGQYAVAARYSTEPGDPSLDVGHDIPGTTPETCPRC